MSSRRRPLANSASPSAALVACRRTRGRVMWIAIAVLLAAACTSAGDADDAGSRRPAPGASALRDYMAGCPADPNETPGHPRLWVTTDHLDELRSRASGDNPLYADGLRIAAEDLRVRMDAGEPESDTGSPAYETDPNESYAVVFAFMSLLTTDPVERADWACRARALLMRVMNEAAKGPAEDAAYRDPDFAIDDRSRWSGANFPLTVDWIHPFLTDEDKETIRRVFLRWAAENVAGGVTSGDRVEPSGVHNDPVLVADPGRTRWASNNYFTAHMRNLGLMALALDPEDDPGGELRSYLADSTGAFLYVFDHHARTDAAGGLLAEGFEYSPQTASYATQLMLALHTAGVTDEREFGRQVLMEQNPFYSDLVTAFLHSITPVPEPNPDFGEVYEPANFGDSQDFVVFDPIEMFGPLAWQAQLSGDHELLDIIRWTQAHVPPGGRPELLDRVASPGEGLLDPILYFLVFDEGSLDPSDPRPGLGLRHFAPGLDRTLARTGWGDDARWFIHALHWSSIDHQHGDGNVFEFYRKGEWLTKERTGYGNRVATSCWKNTLAVANDKPDRDEDDFQYVIWEEGSQYYSRSPDELDPVLRAQAFGDGFVYATGDSTNLYNSGYEEVHAVAHVSRSIVWLEPDHIVIYDRAESTGDGYFKRFCVNLIGEVTSAEGRTVARTPGGQQLAVTTLLPTDAAHEVEVAESLSSEGYGEESANFDPVSQRLVVEAPDDPAAVRFLTVLQGADGDAPIDRSVVVAPDSGTPMSGAFVDGTVVMFAYDIAAPFTGVAYTAPVETARHILTGLEPEGTYSVATEVDDDGIHVRVSPGGGLSADEGGVLVVDGVP